LGGVDGGVLQSQKDQGNARYVANLAGVARLSEESQSPQEVLGNRETSGFEHLEIRPKKEPSQVSGL
jgi:hypothetical protein